MGTTLTRLLYRLPAALLFLMLAALFHAPLLLGLRTFPDGDFTHHFLPFSLFQGAALRAGQLPLWNPYTYSGHPFLADTQAAVFYPLSNLLLLLTMPWTGPGARLYWLQVEAMVHIALAGWFTYLLVRTLTHSRWGGLIAGCCFAFSGYLTGYPPLQLAVLRTAIWLPLLLWLLYHAMHDAGRWRWWIGAALVYATMFFAGHPQTFLHSSYVMGAWLIWLFFVARGAERSGDGSHQSGYTETRLSRPRNALLGVFLFFALTIGLSAAQLLPSLEFTRFSVRANVDYAFVSGGFPLQDSWQLLLPGVLTQFSPLYIGVIGLGLAFIAIVAPRAPHSPQGHGRVLPTRVLAAAPLKINYFPLIISLLFLLLSFGDNSFLYPLFHRFAPGWNLFRGQERAAFVVALGLSMLAGMGAAAIAQLPYGLRRLLAILLAMLVSAGVYLFGILWQLLGQTAVSQIHYLIVAVLTILCALVLVVCLVIPGWDRRRTWLLTGTLLVNLFVVNMGTNFSPFDPVRKTILAPEMEALQGAVVTADQNLVGLPGRVYNEFRIYEDYGMRLAVEDVWGSSPLRLARYAALFDNFPLDRMWQLTGVEYVVTWRRELFGLSTLLAEFPQAIDTTYLHRLPTAHPRAWLVNSVQVADDEAARQQLADHNLDLRQVALLPPDLLTQPITLPPGTNTVQLMRAQPNALQVEVTSENGGLLVISENWLPGWQVEAVQCPTAQPDCAQETSTDGLPRLQPLRTNLTLIGLSVPPGTTRFTLRYWPLSVQLGLSISGATLLLLLLAVGWHWQRRSKGQ